jgi:hypothetical protein
MTTSIPEEARASRRLIASNRVEGTTVYGADQDKLGTIEWLMIDKIGGRVAYAVMSSGGFLGLGEKAYVVPWDKLKYSSHLVGYETDITADQLRASPRFSAEEGADWSDRELAELHAYYGLPPPEP